MTIGEKIKFLRKQHGMTQLDLAKRCGYSSLTTINKIELGINNVPLSTVEKIASVFDVSPAYLMGWDDEKQSKAGAHLLPIDSAILSVCGALSEEQKADVLAFATSLLTSK